jgi:hypothetical protein
MRHAVGGFTQILMHEVDALSGHVVELRERAALARQARGIGQLVRDQVDLLQETRARLDLDHRERRALLHGWIQDLKAVLSQVSSSSRSRARGAWRASAPGSRP